MCLSSDCDPIFASCASMCRPFCRALNKPYNTSREECDATHENSILLNSVKRNKNKFNRKWCRIFNCVLLYIISAYLLLFGSYQMVVVKKYESMQNNMCQTNTYESWQRMFVSSIVNICMGGTLFVVLTSTIIINLTHIRGNTCFQYCMNSLPGSIIECVILSIAILSMFMYMIIIMLSLTSFGSRSLICENIWNEDAPEMGTIMRIYDLQIIISLVGCCILCVINCTSCDNNSHRDKNDREQFIREEYSYGTLPS